MDTIKGYILLVENDDDVKETFTSLLNGEGYIVYSFSSKEDAFNCYQANPIDLAIVDYRLSDDQDQNDNSGLILLEEFEDSLIKILMSAFGPNLFGVDLPKKTWEFDKKKGPETIINLVNKLFVEEVQVNHNLRIPDLEAVLNQSRRFQSLRQPEQAKQRRELVGLFERLFFYEHEIRLKFIQQGYSGAGVVRVTPIYANGAEQTQSKGADVIVKFGEVENMQREFERYSRYVETFLGMRATDVVGSMKFSGSLAGIKFRLIGSQTDWNKPNEVMSFEDAFNAPLVSDGDLDQVVTDLFGKTCHLWYAGKYQPKHAKPSLPSAYMQHFNLDSFERLTEVEEIIDGFIAAGDEDRLTVNVYDRHHLEFDFKNTFESQCILMNPLVLIDKFQDHFPSVYYWSITHGDLNEQNIFVDENQNTWLIDFFRTGDGPALRDVIQLETSLKFFLYKEMSLPRRLEFEWNILAPHQFGDSGYVDDCSNGGQRVANTISSIRDQASLINGDEDMTEYYAGMLFNTLRVMTLKSLNEELGHVENRIRRKHALFSAAVLAHKFSERVQ